MNKKRRLFVSALSGGVIAIPLGAIGSLTPLHAAGLPKLSPENSTAKSLAYTHDSADAAKRCAGCQFFTEPDAEWGPCVIFPEKLVSAKGFCNSWYARA